jgi:sugar lactone lactonase YvrE
MLSRKVIWFSFLAALLLSIPTLVARVGAQTMPAEMRDAALVVGDAIISEADAIRRYDAVGAFIDNMVPVGKAGISASCCFMFGPDENLYVSSVFAGSVLRFNGVTGAFIDTFIPAGSGGLVTPLILLFHEGYLYVGDTGKGAIRRYDAKTGAYVDNFIPDNSRGLGEIFGDLQFFAFGPDKNFYVTATSSTRILRYKGQTGAFIDDFVPASEGFAADGFAFGPDALMYVASFPSGELRRYNVSTGTFDLLVAPGGTLKPFGPVGVVFGPDGNLYVASVGSSEILRYAKTGEFLGAFVPAGLGGLTAPRVITWKVKTKVCHHPPGNPAEGKTLTIGYLSARDHLRHGDTLGRCP